MGVVDAVAVVVADAVLTKIAEKRRFIMVTRNVKQIVVALVVLGAMLAGVVSVFAFSLGKYEKVKISSGVTTIPASKLADGKAHFYKFEDGGKEITFFAVK